VGVVGCDCARFLWFVSFILQVEASEVGQATVRGDATPIEAKFLKHGTAWSEALDGGEKIVEFG
jgi:hypothetical protein